MFVADNSQADWKFNNSTDTASFSKPSITAKALIKLRKIPVRTLILSQLFQARAGFRPFEEGYSKFEKTPRQNF